MSSDIGLNGNNGERTITEQDIQKAIADGKLLPLQEERKEVYYCSKKCCRQYYERTIPHTLVCLVKHPEGHCCHYGERVLTRDEVKKIEQAMFDKVNATAIAIGDTPTEGLK